VLGRMIFTHDAFVIIPIHCLCLQSQTLLVLSYLVTVIYPGTTYTVKLMSISKVFWLQT